MIYICKGPDLFGDGVFRFVLFGGISCSVRAPCYLERFEAGNCHFNSIWKMLQCEPPISMATFWCSNCSYPMALHFGAVYGLSLGLAQGLV